MKKLAWALVGLLATGCQTVPSLPAQPLPAPSMQTAVQLPALHSTPLGDAPADPAALTTRTSAQTSSDPQWVAMRAISDQGGLVQDLTSLKSSQGGYTTQIVPASTQLKAEQAAHAWADDARQVYVGWGFWKTSLLGKVRHVYYSAKKNKALTLEYTLTSFSMKRTESDGTSYQKAFIVLRDAYDTGAYTARDAYSIAYQSGYRPTRDVMACLMHLVLFGDVWIFLDDLSMTPVMIVKADSGDVVTGGPLMWAVQYLIKRGISQ